jgi:hypothetical protein
MGQRRRRESRDTPTLTVESRTGPRAAGRRHREGEGDEEEVSGVGSSQKEYIRLWAVVKCDLQVCIVVKDGEGAEAVRE